MAAQALPGCLSTPRSTSPITHAVQTRLRRSSLFLRRQEASAAASVQSFGCSDPAEVWRHTGFSSSVRQHSRSDRQQRRSTLCQASPRDNEKLPRGYQLQLGQDALQPADLPLTVWVCHSSGGHAQGESEQDIAVGRPLFRLVPIQYIFQHVGLLSCCVQLLWMTKGAESSLSCWQIQQAVFDCISISLHHHNITGGIKLAVLTLIHS